MVKIDFFNTCLTNCQLISQVLLFISNNLFKKIDFYDINSISTSTKKNYIIYDTFLFLQCH